MKKISKVLVLLSLVMCLSGCMKIKVEMDVKSSTEMAMKMDYLIGEEYFAAMGITQEKMIDEMKKKAETALSSATVTPKGETIDGKKWTGVTITGSIKETGIKKILSEKEIDGKKCVVLTLAKDFMASSQFGGINSNDLIGQSEASTEQMKALGLEMSVTINMPADATSNFGKVDGNKVTIDLLELSAKGSSIEKIEISSSLSKGFDMTFVLIGVGVVVILGAVFLIMKKKKTPAREMVEEITPVQEMPQAPVEPVQETQVVEETVQTEEPVQDATPEVNEEVQEVVTEEPVQEVTLEVTETISVEQPAQTDEATTYCPNCGKKVSVNDTFCQKCGFALKK